MNTALFEEFTKLRNEIEQMPDKKKALRLIKKDIKGIKNEAKDPAFAGQATEEEITISLNALGEIKNELEQELHKAKQTRDIKHKQKTSIQRRINELNKIVHNWRKWRILNEEEKSMKKKRTFRIEK